MRILVTGGAGFVGTNLIKQLLEEGHDVISVDNYSTGNVSNHLSVEGFTAIYTKGDVCEYGSYDLPSDDYDIIYHLAYPYGVDGMGLNQAYVDTGAVGTYNVFKYWGCC